MNLNTSLKVICEAIFSNPATATQFGTADANINRSQFATLTNGVAINQVDKAYSETHTLAASASRTLDLTALTDIFAAALAFVRIKAILIFADAGNVNTVNVFKYGATEFVGPLVLGGISADTPTLTCLLAGCLRCSRRQLLAGRSRRPRISPSPTAVVVRASPTTCFCWAARRKARSFRQVIHYQSFIGDVHEQRCINNGNSHQAGAVRVALFVRDDCRDHRSRSRRKVAQQD